jgi:hypothetical protein
MASITQILGTDSLSSSRIILNDNFSALNTELSQIAGLLNTTAQTLTLTGNISARSIILNNGSVDTFAVSTTEAIFNVETSFDANVNVKKGITYSVVGGVTPVTTLPGDNSWEHSTYILDADVFTNPVTLSTAEEGREITLIPSGGDVVFDYTNIAGESVNITLPENKTLTLRYIGSFWYVISNNA